jgi:tetratricopeptide (TPR) repeat protein
VKRASIIVAMIACLGEVALASPASARPSLWERAASTVTPTAEDLDYAHKYAAEMWHSANELESEARHADDPDLARLRRGTALRELQAARAVLDRFGAETSRDARLRYDLGLVLVRLDEYERAVKVLQGALSLGPGSYRASDAWFSLAISYAHLAHRDLEEKAYLEALAVTDDPDFRAIVLANLAESRMGLGKLDEAVEAAESSLALYPDSALTRWTLAVIRDRQGDAFGALTESKRAIALDPFYLQLESPEVFFEPEWDLHWYRGLGELAHADALSGDDKTKRLLSAMYEFDLYVGRAPDDDPWKQRARDHVAVLEKTLALTPKGKAKPIAKPPKK